MALKFRTFTVVGVMLALAVVLLPAHSYAAQAVGKITSLRGDVTVLSGNKVETVTRPGWVLNDGDRVQTGEGEAHITFNDGAEMKVLPFSSSMIEEREEKLGFWIFKTKKAVRRITAFVGKLWFKSGASKRKNFLQTPTAVCALRGTDGFIGFDNVQSYLDLITGNADIAGNVKRGAFEVGKEAAKNSQVFRAITVAKEAAKTQPPEEANVKILEAVMTTLVTMAQNENLSGDAQKAIQVALAVANNDLKQAKEKAGLPPTDFVLPPTIEPPPTEPGTTEEAPPPEEPPGEAEPPKLVEICGDGIDNDNDGLVDEDCSQEVLDAIKEIVGSPSQ